MSYMGPFYPIRNEPPMHHIVRVGWDTPKHPDEEHVDFWTLAHGLPDAPAILYSLARGPTHPRRG